MILEILFLMIMVVLYFFKTRKSLHMMQQNLYNENNRYLKWVKSNKNYFINVELIVLFLAAVGFFVAYDFNNYFVVAVLLITCFYLLEIFLWNKRNKEEQQKKPLVVTARVKRLIVTMSILYLIPIILLFTCSDTDIKRIWLFIFIITAMMYLNMFITLIAVLINMPIEKIVVYQYYFNKAKTKLKNMKHIKVIGVAGSYGKTTSKNILSDVLNIKYNALPTPRNLNTPYGLMITINNHLDKFTEVFIAEMGAYKRGEVADLVKFVKPKYGILTNLGTDHLDSYGSEENIKIGNFELVEGLPLDGLAVLNGDDPKQLSYVEEQLKNKVPLKWIGINNKDVDIRAENIKVSHQGVTFDVIFKDDKKKYKFETKLLGSHNVYNILAAIALGIEMDIDMKDLQKAVSLVKPVQHRLELKKLGNFWQIDDAYNSNPVGAKSACEVLGMMPGIKVVVTPGMIELADREHELNKEFGKQIAEVADYAVLIGEKRTRPIMEGLKEAGFNDKNIIVYNDVKKAYDFINGLTGKKDVYALFENDLPDTYNE